MRKLLALVAMGFAILFAGHDDLLISAALAVCPSTRVATGACAASAVLRWSVMGLEAAAASSPKRSVGTVI